MISILKIVSIDGMGNFLDNQIGLEGQYILDIIDIKTKKTSEFVTILKDLKLENKKVTMLVSSFQDNLILSSRNVRNVFIEDVKNISVYDMLDSEIIITDKQGLTDLMEVLA